MDWIYSTHLAQLATFQPATAYLGLCVWTKSGAAPYQHDAPHYPVTLGTPADAAAFTGLALPTVRRHWADLKRAFVEIEPGRFAPSLSAWQEPTEGPTDAKGRPLYVRLAPQAVQALSTLPRCAPAKLAWSAFKIAVALLPRMRAAAYRGRDFVVWTNDQICDALKIGRSTLKRAFTLLEARGLLFFVRGRYRKICTRNGLLAMQPASGERYQQPVQKPVDNFRRSDQTGTAAVIKSGPILKDELDLTKEQTPREARAVECPDPQVVKVIKNEFPTLQPKGVADIAKRCKSASHAQQWIDQERPALEIADNPPGLFLYLIKTNQSALGKPSTWTNKLLAKQGRRRAALMQWTLKPTDPRVEEHREQLRQERDERAKAKQERRQRLDIGIRKAETAVTRIDKRRAEAVSKDEGRNRVNELLKHLGMD